jgi:hypothetical protein
MSVPLLQESIFLKQAPALFSSLSSPTLASGHRLPKRNPAAKPQQNVQVPISPNTASELAEKKQLIVTLQDEVNVLASKVRDLEQQHSVNLQQLCSVLSEKEKYIRVLEQRIHYETVSNKAKTLAMLPSTVYSPPVKRKAAPSEIEFETLETRLGAAKSVNTWLGSELKRLEKENSFKIASRDSQIQRLSYQLEFMQKRSSPNEVPKYVEDLKNENEELRERYFCCLALFEKLRVCEEGKLCNSDLLDLYELTKRDRITILQWPTWIANELQKSTFAY